MKFVRSGFAAVALILSVACESAVSTAPVPDTPPEPPPRSWLPPLSGPSRTFVFGGELEYPVSNGTKLSKYIFYDNGAFVLTADPVSPGYRGVYLETTDGEVLFSWEGWSRAGPWGAYATLKGDSLTVRYNEIMQMTDFEDALYIRQR